MSDDDKDAAELMSTYRTIFEALQEALKRGDEPAIFIHGGKFLQFLSVNGAVLGLDISPQVESTLAMFNQVAAAAAKEMREMRIAAQQEADEKMIKFGEEILWRRLQVINSTPLLFRGTTRHRKALKELAPAFELYAQYFDLITVESTIRHFRARLDFYKKMRANGERFAPTAEKIAILAKALDDFQNIYEAEQAEQRETILAAHEATRIRKLFDEIDQSDLPPVVRRGN